MFDKKTQRKWQMLKVLIIDEISMVQVRRHASCRIPFLQVHAAGGTARLAGHDCQANAAQTASTFRRYSIGVCRRCALAY